MSTISKKYLRNKGPKDFKNAVGVKAELQAFIDIYEACCQDSEYTDNTRRLSGQKWGRKYWDLPEELCPRAFEAYIQDTALDWGIKKAVSCVWHFRK